MDFATQLLHVMTDPDFACDIRYRDVPRISDQELGALLPAATP
ncbi:hypothetical protein OHB56_27390 [Streptomyces sp. NBC_01635]|nr:hypothetical protein OHB56_27390 [Streptomyces sp. NBC_01635]